MTAQEFVTIAAAIRAAWPAANIMPDKQSKEVWYTMLADLDYSACMIALKEHMSTCKFAPSISELRERCSNIISPPAKSWSDAWGEVMTAIRFFGMYREEDAMKQLDDITRKCVKRLGFQNLCTSENMTADRANFRMAYEQEQKAEKEIRQLPPALQQRKRDLQQLTVQTTKQLSCNKGGNVQAEGK